MKRTLLVAALVVTSCEQTNGVPPSPAPPVVVELGTGDTSFEALPADGEVSLVFGPQGGYHVWTAVRVRDPGFDRGYVNLRASHAGGSVAGLPSSEGRRWVRTPDGTQEAAGLRMFVSDAFPPATRLTLRVEVVASDGRHGAVERPVRVR